ncbi:YdcF family protein [Emcibacter nanhaiensis]|uniref:YdcF family protein n=1 Tax=Emcibacter nanhaiensis TaxID=1505037 RepID=A0A501PPG5_9PROT|nr:YdcF family protein [Emcibacter nanhaiensis]TPD61661.1 YdcF family protein [Emcibacter nanhaiensis]
MKLFYYIAISLFLIWLGGFGWFLHGLSAEQDLSARKADAIVVLTGGRNRLEEAAKLLKNHMGEKLFISGVNEVVTEQELYDYLDSGEELADCCIEIGREALNTEGNARETALWMTRNHYTSLRLVTSLEHMPRALVEMKRFMPETEIIGHPVGNWRPENTRFYSLAREYNKYVFSLVRAVLTDKLTSEKSLEEQPG